MNLTGSLAAYWRAITTVGTGEVAPGPVRGVAAWTAPQPVPPPEDAYRRCKTCEVEWRGPAPCWFCGRPA